MPRIPSSLLVDLLSFHWLRVVREDKDAGLAALLGPFLKHERAATAAPVSRLSTLCLHDGSLVHVPRCSICGFREGFT